MLSQSCNTKYAFFLTLYVFRPQDVGLEEDSFHAEYCSAVVCKFLNSFQPEVFLRVQSSFQPELSFMSKDILRRELSE